MVDAVPGAWISHADYVSGRGATAPHTQFVYQISDHTRLSDMTNTGPDHAVSYEPPDTPPLGHTIKIAIQLSILVIVRLSLLPLLAVQLAGHTDATAFRAIAVSSGIGGAIMLLLTCQTGRYGAKNLYVIAIDAASLPFCILAMANGGLTALAALVMVSGLFQIVIGMRLSRLRRLISPTINGTLLILSCISLTPVLFRSLIQTQSDHSPLTVLICMATTTATILSMQKLGPRSWRIWAGPAGIVVGMITSMILGIYDYAVIQQAAWVGIPSNNAWKWDQDTSTTFLTLLPSFLLLAFMNLGKTNNLSIFTQFVSWKQLHSVDFRDIQKANNSIGLGSVLSGIAGSMPIALSPLGPAFIKASKCASLRVGTMHGAILLGNSILPKSMHDNARYTPVYNGSIFIIHTSTTYCNCYTNIPACNPWHLESHLGSDSDNSRAVHRIKSDRTP